MSPDLAEGSVDAAAPGGIRSWHGACCSQTPVLRVDLPAVLKLSVEASHQPLLAVVVPQLLIDRAANGSLARAERFIPGRTPWRPGSEHLPDLSFAPVLIRILAQTSIPLLDCNPLHDPPRPSAGCPHRPNHWSNHPGLNRGFPPCRCQVVAQATDQARALPIEACFDLCFPPHAW